MPLSDYGLDSRRGPLAGPLKVTRMHSPPTTSPKHPGLLSSVYSLENVIPIGKTLTLIHSHFGL